MRPTPRDSAILVVDVQDRLLPAMPEPRRADLLRAATLLLSAAAELSIRVACTEQYPQGLGPTTRPVLDLLGPLGVRPISKVCFSALDQPEAKAALLEPAPADVVVVGMEAHVCVYQTVRDLRAAGLRVHVPIDGVCSRRDDHRDAALGLLRGEGALVTTTETLVFDWLRQAGGDAFKRLSKLIR